MIIIAILRLVFFSIMQVSVRKLVASVGLPRLNFLGMPVQMVSVMHCAKRHSWQVLEI